MAVKFDKELLLKHYFWIVSGVFLLLVLILVVMEAINAPGQTEKTAFESSLKSVQGLTSGFKNDKFLPAWEARFKEYEEDKNSVWGQAWAPQSTIYDWPDAIRERETLKNPTTNQAEFPTYPNYFNYPIRDKSKGTYLFPLVIYPNMTFTDDERREYKDSLYAEQFDKAWAFMNAPWKNPINDQDTMMSHFRPDQQGDLLQPGLPFRLAVSASAAPTGGMGGDGPGAGPVKGGGGGMSMPGGAGAAPIGGAMPGMSGLGMPGMGAPGGANAASAADAKGAFMSAMRKFTAWQRTPSKEEIWILQEDYWIRRELISLLRESVASIATFHPVPGEHPVPEGATGRYKAANAFWELDLIFENGGRSISKKSSIRNVHIQQRPQPIADPRSGIQTEFAFFQNQFQKNTRIKMDGEVLPFGKSQTFAKEYPNTGAVDFNKPFDLVQIFYPGTSPIRVLDSLELPFNSHRTTTSKLVARSTLKKEGPSSAAAGAPGAEGGGGGGGGDMGTPMMMPGMSGASSRASSVDLTPYNKQLRSRYMISNKQCRHVPFAMKLTLDQSTLPTLITALANSKLRIQVTQVQYQYIPFNTSSSIGGMGMPGGPGGIGGGKAGMGGGGYPGGSGALKPGGFPGGSGPAFGGFPGAGGAAPGGYPNPGGGGFPGGAMPGGGFPGGRNDEGGEGPRMGDGSGGAQGTGALADGNLIDVAIYGIAVLYERFPPAKENPADAAADASANATAAPASTLPPGGGADRDK